jgi:hypothetical protein
MPRIAKWSEKNQCILSQPVKLKIAHSGVNKNGTIINIIEDIIASFDFDSVIPKCYENFVDVKEVPYGRHNSDTDYR